MVEQPLGSVEAVHMVAKLPTVLVVWERVAFGVSYTPPTPPIGCTSVVGRLASGRHWQGVGHPRRHLVGAPLSRQGSGRAGPPRGGPPVPSEWGLLPAATAPALLWQAHLHVRYRVCPRWKVPRSTAPRHGLHLTS